VAIRLTPDPNGMSDVTRIIFAFFSNDLFMYRPYLQILADVDAIIESLPTIHSSMSEPIVINLTEDDTILGLNAED
jgi:hypothetical protein